METIEFPWINVKTLKKLWGSFRNFESVSSDTALHEFPRVIVSRMFGKFALSYREPLDIVKILEN